MPLSQWCADDRWYWLSSTSPHFTCCWRGKEILLSSIDVRSTINFVPLKASEQEWPAWHCGRQRSTCALSTAQSTGAIIGGLEGGASDGLEEELVGPSDGDHAIVGCGHLMDRSRICGHLTKEVWLWQSDGLEETIRLLSFDGLEEELWTAGRCDYPIVGRRCGHLTAWRRNCGHLTAEGGAVAIWWIGRFVAIGGGVATWGEVMAIQLLRGGQLIYYSTNASLIIALL